MAERSAPFDPSLDAAFEAAVDAIVTGDLSGLASLLEERPELARASSSRAHEARLLHYTAANGVEDERQRTPPNVVAIAEMLLRAGADVDAIATIYGGSTPLDLAATSVHPERAGVQNALIDALLDHGARATSATVVAALANGRGAAAAHLAARGIPLDFEGAAGVGRLDLVRDAFGSDDVLSSSVTERQLRDGFAWACEFGRTDVVAFLLGRGVGVATKLKHHGQTALHWAAHGGHVDTVELLVRSGSDLGAKDDAFDGTPLDWALHEYFENAADSPEADRLGTVIERLVAAGADLGAASSVLAVDRRERLRGDPRLGRLVATIGDR